MRWGGKIFHTSLLLYEEKEKRLDSEGARERRKTPPS